MKAQPSPHFTPHFTLYSRSWCHLCEDMEAALRACMARLERAYTVDVIDIDSDPRVAPQLRERYDELVPVLTGGPMNPGGPDTPELCHYFLDEAAVLRHLDAG